MAKLIITADQKAIIDALETALEPAFNEGVEDETANPVVPAMMQYDSLSSPVKVGVKIPFKTLAASLIKVLDLPASFTPDNLDLIPNGTIYGKLRLNHLDVSVGNEGNLLYVTRSGTLTPVTDLFKHTGASPDTLDVIGNGATYGKIRKDHLDVSVGNEGKLIYVTRGGVLTAVTDLFKRGTDTLSDVQDDASYKRVAAGHMSGNTIVNIGVGLIPATDLFRYTGTGAHTLDDVAEGTLTYGKVKKTQLTAGEITSIRRGLNVVTTASMFQHTGTGSDTLDVIGDGATYGKVKGANLTAGDVKMDTLLDGTYARVKATMLTAGEVTSVKRGANVVTVTNMFQTAGTGADTLDVIADGATNGKVKLTQLTAGEVTSVKRGVNVVAVADLFQHSGTGSETLDIIPNGTTYGKVANTMLTAGEVTSVKRGANVVTVTNMFQTAGTGSDTLDVIADGTTNGKVKLTQLTAGEVTSVKRGANLVTTTTLFQHTGTGKDSLDAIDDGGTFAKVKAAMLTTGEITSIRRGANVVTTVNMFQTAGTGADTLDVIADGVTNGKVKLTQLTAGEITSVKRGANVVTVANLFQFGGTGSETLDVIPDGSTYGKVTNTMLTAGEVTSVKRGANVVAVANMFQHTGTGKGTLDLIDDGTTHGKVLASTLTAGKVKDVVRGVGLVATDDLFEIGVNTLDQVAEGATYNRVLAAGVNGGYVSKLDRSGTAEASTNYFKPLGTTPDVLLPTYMSTGSREFLPPNGTFSSGTNGWTAYGGETLEASSDGDIGSSPVVECKTLPTTVNSGMESLPFPLPLSSQYLNFRGAFRATLPGASAGDTLRVQIEYRRHATGAAISTENADYDATTLGTYTTKEAVFTRPSTARWAVLRLVRSAVVGDGFAFKASVLQIESNIVKNIAGYVGIGNPNPEARLHVGLTVADDNNYVYDVHSTVLTQQVATNTAVLNDPKDVLHLARQGTPGNAYGAAAVFKLSRWENNGVNSRTRVDIDLAHGAYLASPVTVLRLYSNNSVVVPGILLVDTAGSVLAQASWTALTYGTNWADYGGSNMTGACFKDSNGVVHLRGLIKRTVSGNAKICTLPSGHWPSATVWFNATYSVGGVMTGFNISVTSTGDVFFGTFSGPSTNVVDLCSLNGISFDTRA